MKLFLFNVQDLPKGCDTPKEYHLVEFWWLWVVQKVLTLPFLACLDLMMEAGRHRKDLATTLRPFPLARFVLLLLFSLDLPLFWWLLSQPQDSWRYHHFIHGMEKKQRHPWAKWGWGWSGRTLLHRGAQGRRAWACWHSDRMADCRPLQSGKCGFPDWMLC